MLFENGMAKSYFVEKVSQERKKVDDYLVSWVGSTSENSWTWICYEIIFNCLS